MNFSKFVLAANMATTVAQVTAVATPCAVNYYIKVVGASATCTACPDGRTNVSGDTGAGETACETADKAFKGTAAYASDKLTLTMENVDDAAAAAANLVVASGSEIEIIFPEKPDGTPAFTTANSWSKASGDDKKIVLSTTTATSWLTSIEITGITNTTKFANNSTITVNYKVASNGLTSTAAIAVPESLKMASSGSSLSVLSLALLLVA